MSLIETLLTYDYGQADQKAAADEWAGKAEASGGNIDEHFASYALWLVGQGKAEEAATPGQQGACEPRARRGHVQRHEGGTAKGFAPQTAGSDRR